MYLTRLFFYVRTMYNVTWEICVIIVDSSYKNYAHYNIIKRVLERVNIDVHGTRPFLRKLFKAKIFLTKYFNAKILQFTACIMPYVCMSVSYWLLLTCTVYYGSNTYGQVRSHNP